MWHGWIGKFSVQPGAGGSLGMQLVSCGTPTLMVQITAQREETAVASACYEVGIGSGRYYLGSQNGTC